MRWIVVELVVVIICFTVCVNAGKTNHAERICKRLQQMVEDNSYQHLTHKMREDTANSVCEYLKNVSYQSRGLLNLDLCKGPLFENSLMFFFQSELERDLSSSN